MTSAPPEFVPFDAGHQQLMDHLDDLVAKVPGWYHVGRVSAYLHLYRYQLAGSERRSVSVEVPAGGTEDFADYRPFCAEAAHRINAVALGIPHETMHEAVHRLVRIAWRCEDDADHADIYAMATGRQAGSPPDRVT
ncbi:hypothetical protein ETD86_37270 [Nonomuraea turkmeniaca]|uniref:Uncharacterized protein n=1 Tax=Nonomuraea turkmeniaca TaxID=103838 RepID=A0A5S4F4J5_9ACTN|nr:hypothetical protein [Nonomuraea turkmeniaca]TMR10970.1 hypothetical protein ETD86_37270 [Nonomuraea turkmeniaca]